MEKKRNNQIDYKSWESERAESGKSVVEFCKARGINPSVYYYWRKKQLRENDSKFAHVSLSSSGHGSGIRILYPNGVQVELYGEVNVAQMKTLIDVGI